MGGSVRRRDSRRPVGTTSLVDRRDEQAQGRELPARTRPVTLTGPGGVGRTRLAGRMAARVERAFRVPALSTPRIRSRPYGPVI
jgi:MoxR-like ATPase